MSPSRQSRDDSYEPLDSHVAGGVSVVRALDASNTAPRALRAYVPPSGALSALLAARTEGDLDQAVELACSELRFSWGSGFAAWRLRDGHSDWGFRRFGRVPSTYATTWQDPDLSRRDPVMRWLRTSYSPIVWTRETYADADELGMWESMAAAGLVHGIAATLTVDHARRLVFGFESSDPTTTPANSTERAILLANFHLIHAYVLDAYTRVIGWPPSQGFSSEQLRPLRTREREVLRWTSEGKTALEIGMILGLSEVTVRKHLESATRALGSTNKTHAIAIAIRMQLI